MNKITPLRLSKRNDRYKSIGHSLHRKPIKDNKSNKIESFELFTESMKINKFKLIVYFNNQWEKHKHYGINSSSF